MIIHRRRSESRRIIIQVGDEVKGTIRQDSRKKDEIANISVGLHIGNTLIVIQFTQIVNQFTHHPRRPRGS